MAGSESILSCPCRPPEPWGQEQGAGGPEGEGGGPGPGWQDCGGGEGWAGGGWGKGSLDEEMERRWEEPGPDSRCEGCDVPCACPHVLCVLRGMRGKGWGCCGHWACQQSVGVVWVPVIPTTHHPSVPASLHPPCRALQAVWRAGAAGPPCPSEPWGLPQATRRLSDQPLPQVDAPDAPDAQGPCRRPGCRGRRWRRQAGALAQRRGGGGGGGLGCS